MAKKPNTIEQHRSAKTGRFVTEKYANTHKATTVKEYNKKSSGGKKK